MAQKDTDLQKIKELIEIMKQNGLTEVEIKHGDDKIFLKRCDTETVLRPAVGQSSQTPAPVPQQEDDLVEIKSPIVGTFYATPSPDSEPFVEVGSQVSQQTVVCVVEAMKVMNEIKAETSGTIAEILLKSGQAVEYGQVLFKIKPE